MDLTGLELSITAFHIKFSDQMGLILNNPGLLFSGAYNQYYMLNPTLAQVQARYPTNFGPNGNALVATTGFPGPLRTWRGFARRTGRSLRRKVASNSCRCRPVPS